MPIDILKLIPQSLKQQMMDAVVDVVAEKAVSFLGDGAAEKIRQLRSDGRFQKEFEEGLVRASIRFKDEYEEIDEDLVQAIGDNTIFADKKARKALLRVLKAPDSLLEDEQLIIVDSFESVLPERKNRERVNKAISYFLKCVAKEVWHIAELRPVYSFYFQRISAEASVTQVNLLKAQLSSLSNIESGIQTTLLQLTDAIVEQKLLSSGAQEPDDTHGLIHNLPHPDYGVFIGREAELQDIANLLRPYPHSRYHIIVIDGIGGIGKSALALESAYRYVRDEADIAADEQFKAIVWISAKKSVLTGDGAKSRMPAFHNLHDILTNIVMVMGWEMPFQESQLSRFIVKELTQTKVLLIVDNLETVDDEHILSFLRELPPPTKAIVTTRHRIDVAYPIRLRGMPLSDARQLIEHEANEKSLALTEEHIRLLYKRTGGVPLAMVWSIAKMGFGYGIDYVLSKLGEPTNDVSKFCFDQSLEVIRGKPAYTILLTLASSDDGGTQVWLSQVTQLPLYDLEDGLVNLERLSLVNKDGDHFTMLPLTLSYCKAELNSDNKQAATVREQVPAIQEKLYDEALHRYYSYIQSTYGKVRTFGSLEFFELKDLYINVEVLPIPQAIERFSLESLEQAFKQNDSQHAPTLSGVQVLKDHQYLFVLGRAGIGKTTFLKHLAIEASTNPEFTKIPIFVSIREFSTSGLSIIDFLADEFETVGLIDARKFVRNQLYQGNLLILLDGLDEVADVNIRREIISVIRSLVRRYPDNQFVISSRVAATDYTLERFRYIEIADFSLWQIEKFVELWFDDKVQAQTFLVAIKQNEYLLELAHSPLFLTLLCTVYSFRRTLPERRAELYEESVGALLQSWDFSRNIQRTTIYEQLTNRAKRELFASIAIQMQVAEIVFQSKEKLIAQIIDYLSSLPFTAERASVDGEVILREIVAQHGILVERALGIYSFAHISFQEYFAARYIVDHPEQTSSFVHQFLENERWKEIFLLVASLSNKPSEYFISGIEVLEQLTSDQSSHLYVKQLLVEGLELSYADDKDAIMDSIINA